MRAEIYQFIKARQVDPDKLLTWAFGPDFNSVGSMDQIIRWNERHGDLLRLEPHDRIGDSLERIISAYQMEVRRGLG